MTRGSFPFSGKVFKGEILGPDGKTLSPVAVKTLKADATPKVSADFRREADLMVALKHPNIVCLVGVCPKANGSNHLAAMLFEHMTQGDLHEYLVTHSARGASTGSGNGPGGPGLLSLASRGTLEQADLLHIATQVKE